MDSRQIRMIRRVSFKYKVFLALSLFSMLFVIAPYILYPRVTNRNLLKQQVAKFVDVATTPKKTTQITNKSISLFVRLPATVQKFKERLYCVLLRTTVLFWPASYGKIVVVFDDESSEDHKLGEQLKKQFDQNFSHRKLDVLYEPLPKDPTIVNFSGPKFWQRPGYNRQLWSSFFIDLYTNDSIIAWMDTDSPFLTPVTEPTIFNGTRLRILGSECSMNFGYVKNYDTTGINERLLGLPMVADFMMYFPVYVYRDTFTNTRNYILKRFKTNDFDDVFRKVYNKDTGLISPVSVILSYAWFYEHDRYDWSIQMCTDLDTYNKRFLDARFKIRPEHAKSLFAQPHTAFHSSPMEKFSIFSPIIPITYCLAKERAGEKPAMCASHSSSEIKELFILYNVDLQRVIRGQTECKGNATMRCLKVLEDIHDRVALEMRRNERRLEWEDMETMERLAKEVGVSCFAIRGIFLVLQDVFFSCLDYNFCKYYFVLSCLFMALVILFLFYSCFVTPRKSRKEHKCKDLIKDS